MVTTTMLSHYHYDNGSLIYDYDRTLCAGRLLRHQLVFAYVLVINHNEHKIIRFTIIDVGPPR